MAKPSRIKNLGVAGISALTGCVSLIVVLGALLLGLWVDHRWETGGFGVVIILILSVPLSLYLMTRIALTLVQYIEPPKIPRDTDTMDEKEE
mgnify:CR=1 FL=1